MIMCPWYTTASYLILNLTGFPVWNSFICTGGASLGVNLALHLGTSNTQLPTGAMVWEPELCSEQAMVSPGLCLRVCPSPLNRETRHAPAGIFLSSPTGMASVGSTTPGSVPRSKHLRDIGSQESPGLTKHMLLKLTSSLFEIRFLHEGDRKYILLKDKSSAIKGLIIVLVFFMELLSDIHVWDQRPAFLQSEYDPPIFQGNITAWGMAKRRALLILLSCGPSILAFRNPKTHENISEGICHLLKQSCFVCQLWGRGVKWGWRTWTVDKFQALVSTMSEGLCPVLADEGWDGGNDDSVDEKPLGPCTLGKALQAQGLRHIAQAPHMMVSSQQLPFKLFWPLTAQMLLNSLSSWTKTQSRIVHVQLRIFSIFDPSRKISS